MRNIEKMKDEPLFQLMELLDQSNDFICKGCNKKMTKWERTWVVTKNSFTGPLCGDCNKKEFKK